MWKLLESLHTSLYSIKRCQGAQGRKVTQLFPLTINGVKIAFAIELVHLSVTCDLLTKNKGKIYLSVLLAYETITRSELIRRNKSL